MKMLPKMETIIEELTANEPANEPGSPKRYWKGWYTSDIGWGQWTDIEYIDIYEPTTAPPEIR
jgi:hypothetical protein